MPGTNNNTNANRSNTRRAGESFIIIAQKNPRAIRQKRYQRDSPSRCSRSTSFE
jgi:hypothetical protein